LRGIGGYPAELLHVVRISSFSDNRVARGILWGQAFLPAAGLPPGAERYEFRGNSVFSFVPYPRILIPPKARPAKPPISGCTEHLQLLEK
jgi:hypothetical protein